MLCVTLEVEYVLEKAFEGLVKRAIWLPLTAMYTMDRIQRPELLTGMYRFYQIICKFIMIMQYMGKDGSSY